VHILFNTVYISSILISGVLIIRLELSALKTINFLERGTRAITMSVLKGYGFSHDPNIHIRYKNSAQTAKGYDQTLDTRISGVNLGQ